MKKIHSQKCANNSPPQKKKVASPTPNSPNSQLVDLWAPRTSKIPLDTLILLVVGGGPWETSLRNDLPEFKNDVKCERKSWKKGKGLETTGLDGKIQPQFTRSILNFECESQNRH